MDISSLSDEALMKGLQETAEDKDRFSQAALPYLEELYNRYYVQVLKLLMYYGLRKEEAEDVTQDVFLQVYDSLPAFRGGSAFSTWLYRVAVNAAITHVRKEKRHPHIPLDALREFRADIDAEPEQQATRMETQQAVQEMLAQLPEQQRAVLVLRYFQELSLEEMAEVLNCSVAAVKVRLHRARNSFRRLFQKRHPQEDGGNR